MELVLSAVSISEWASVQRMAWDDDLLFMWQLI